MPGHGAIVVIAHFKGQILSWRRGETERRFVMDGKKKFVVTDKQRLILGDRSYEVVRRAREGSIDPDGTNAGLQLLIEGKRIISAEPRIKRIRGEKMEIYPTSVNYDLSIAELVQACDLGWVDDNINDNNFPVVGIGTMDFSLVLVSLGWLATEREIWEYMHQRNLWPADFKQQLAFGATFPDKQLEFTIVAFGSVWVNSNGFRRVAYLFGNGGQRKLGLSFAYPGSQWNEYYRFLAVSQG